jgi:hypothetical protein
VSLVLPHFAQRNPLDLADRRRVDDLSRPWSRSRCRPLATGSEAVLHGDKAYDAARSAVHPEAEPQHAGDRDADRLMR